MNHSIRGRLPAARVPAATGILLTAVLIAACSGGPAGPATTPALPSALATPVASGPAGAAADAVTIQGFAFKPETITISAGTTVTWANQDSVAHTVTADDGSFDSTPVAGGTAFSQVFATPGTFAYHCTIHPTMKGTIVVQ